MDSLLKEIVVEALTGDDNVNAIFTNEDGDIVVWLTDTSQRALSAYEPLLANLRTRSVSGNVLFEKVARPTAPPAPFPDHQIPRVMAVDPTGQHRPSPSGVSIAHVRVTAGTQGFVAETTDTGDWVVVSNNHVEANQDNANVGDKILQPGPADGGENPKDILATLLRWIPLFSGPTPKYSDAAAGKVTAKEVVSLETLNLGFINGVVDPYVGMEIASSGRTTGSKRGRVLTTDAVVTVDYGGGRTRTIHNCVISDIASGPGDSGSGIMDFITRRLIGLLFAGNGQYTIICQQKYFMRPVAENGLGLKIIPPPYKLYSGALDLSHWNDPINSEADLENNFKANLLDLTIESFSTIKAMGYEVVILKVCQPGVGIDPKFIDYYNYARQVGLEVTGYIFVDPAFGVDAHMNLFDEAMTGGKSFDLPPDIDAERTSGKSPGQITELMIGLSQRLEAWYTKGLPLIYSSLSWLNENLLAWIIDGKNHWADHPLHLAWWSKNALQPIVPSFWSQVVGAPDIWQVGPYPIGPKIGVGSLNVDLNLIRPKGQRLRNQPQPPPGDKVTLTITIDGQGTVTPAGGQYVKGSVVKLTAIPSTGWEFHSWDDGSVVDPANPVDIVMDRDRTIQAMFIQSAPSELAEFIYNKGKTLVAGQYIRNSPTVVGSKVIGSLLAGMTISILELMKDTEGNTWARIGYDYTRRMDQFAAVFHRGKQFIHVLTKDEV